MISLILLIMALALVLYCVFAGADFGAGVVEGLSSNPEEDRKVIQHAMGPVWEANHIWIILVVVILFTGFPDAFALISIEFHFPLTLMLFGIVIRGCAFTYRSYDAFKDESHALYSRGFILSSLVTPFTMGMMAGGSLLGRVNPQEIEAIPRFLLPWCNIFCICVGFFVVSLFTFNAAAFLVGETTDITQAKRFSRYARRANFAALIFGGLVFLTSHLDGLNLFHSVADSLPATLCMVSASALLLPLWWALEKRHALFLRGITVIQMTLILVGWFAIQFPHVIRMKGSSLTYYEAAAPAATLLQMVIALGVGLALVVPLLLFLFRTFNSTPSSH